MQIFFRWKIAWMLRRLPVESETDDVVLDQAWCREMGPMEAFHVSQGKTYSLRQTMKFVSKYLQWRRDIWPAIDLRFYTEILTKPWPGREAVPARLRITSSLTYPDGSRGSAGTMTIIRIGANSFRGCFCNVSVSDMGEIPKWA